MLRKLFILLAVGAVSGCEEANSNEAGTIDFSASLDDRQIDRVGRPLTNIVFVDALATVAGVAHEDVLDDFNRGNPEEAALFLRAIGGTLALLDAADGTCGNQIGRDVDPEDRPYSTLTNVIADDRLYLSIEDRSCSEFFGLEQQALGAGGRTCGGRIPGADAVGVLYSEVLHLEDGLMPQELAVDEGLPFLPLVDEP